MAVIIGSARGDENGKAHGGRAGDQTGREVSTQNWYKHSKGWRVFRAKSVAAAEKIAQAMEAACANPHIGYDQYERSTLYAAAEKVGFDPAKVTTDTETDCSALVRVCCAFAGIMVPNFRTPDEPEKLLNSGAFVELTGAKYTDSSTYLRRGDILDTRTQGHTVVVLSNGSKAEPWPPEGQAEPEPTPSGTITLGRILKRGCVGEDVRQVQSALIKLGYSCGPDGADGDYGAFTQTAVRRFQQARGLEDDGEVGPITLAALNKDIANVHPPAGKWVRATGDVNVRSAPNTNGRILGVLKKGERLPYQGEDSPEGWHLVERNGENGWISPKYSEVTTA